MDDGLGDGPQAGPVAAGVLAQQPERLVDGDPLLGGEHALGLLDDDAALSASGAGR